MPARTSLASWAALIAWVLATATGVLAQGPENVLILVNENSDDSRAIASYYALKRGIPDSNVCRLRTTLQERISRRDFNREILEPVADFLRSGGLQDRILYLVTTKGVPIIVEGQSGPVGDLASVDSELSLLYHYMLYGSFPAFGRIENPYFAYSTDTIQLRPFHRRTFDIFLVTRLTGADSAQALALIDRGTQAVDGRAFRFDLPADSRSLQRDWLQSAANVLSAKGYPVSLMPSGAQSGGQGALLGYASWGVADPFLKGRLPEVEWSPGAIGLTFEPESAASFKAAAEESESPPPAAVQAVQAGMTGFGGFAADPTQDGLFRPQILFPAYISGFNLAESFYQSIRYLGWRGVVVGDPLAAPFPERSAEVRSNRPEDCATDAASGIPECFHARRKNYLVGRYNTSEEVVAELLRAENAAETGRQEEALQLLTSSLQKNPLLLESHLLKARIQEEQGNFGSAFESYQRAYELGAKGQERLFKLAQLSLRRLADAQKAAGYARRLYLQTGGRDIEAAQLWAEAALGSDQEAQAIAAYQRLAQTFDPPPPFALAALARIYQEKDETAAAAYAQQGLQAQAEDEGEYRRKGFGLSEADEQLLQQLAPRESTPEESAAPVQPSDEGREAPVPTSPDSFSSPAVVLKRTDAEYPGSARRRRIQGLVVLRLLIDEQGQLLKSEPVTGHETLVKAARKSVSDWIFRPRILNGKAVTSYLNVTIRFNLAEAKR